MIHAPHTGDVVKISAVPSSMRMFVHKVYKKMNNLMPVLF